eukprot:gene10358-19059_t
MDISAAKDLAVELLTSYLESTDENEYYLFEAISSLIEYIEENGGCVDEGKPKSSDKHSAAVIQLSLIADWLFASKGFSLCCLSLEAALKLLNNFTKDSTDTNLPTKMSLFLKLSSSNLQLDNTKEAIDNAMVCLKDAIEKSNKLLEMQSCIIIANAYQRSKNYVEAVYYNTKLLDIGRQATALDKERLEWNNHLECRVLWNISACYNSINDTANALVYAKEYLNAIKFGSQENMTDMYSYVGKLLYQNGEYEEAITMHETELAICKRFNDRVGMGYAYGNIGLVYAAVQKEPLASEFLDQQFRIAKSTEDVDLLLKAIQNQAESSMALGNVTTAIENFKSLLKLAKENHFWTIQCIAYKNIGKLYQMQRTFNFARFYLEEAMNRAYECSMRDDEIDAQMHLAQVLNVLGYYEKSRKHFKEVIIHFEKLLNKQHHFEIQACSEISNKLENCCKDLQDVLVKLKRHAEALEIAEHCHSRTFFNALKRKNARRVSHVDIALPLTISHVEKILSEQSNTTVVLYYTLTKNGYYLWMMRPGKGIVKFVSHNSMAAYPLDSLVRTCVRSLATTKKGNRCCYDSEYKQKTLGLMESHSQAIVRKLDSNTNAPQSLDVIEQQTFEQSSGFEHETPKIECRVFRSEGGTKYVDDRVHCSLPNDESPVKIPKETTYDSGYDSSLSRDLKSRDDIDVEKYPLATSPSPEHADTRENNDHTLDHKKLLRELFDILLGYVEHLLLDLKETKNVIVITDGILNIVPFHLLLDENNRPMHTKFEVSISPCLAALEKQSPCHRSEPSDVVVFGNASLSDASLKNINGDSISYQSEAVEEELNLVAKTLGVRAIAGKAATKDSFMKLLPEAEIVHVSAIGSESDGCLLLTPNSHRQLPDAERESYVFGLNDLMQLDLKAKLVVLSSCSQCPHGLARSTKFKSNLAAGFLASGVVAVVTFLYSMPHKTQLYLLHQLFRNLEKGNSVAQALRHIYNEMDSCEKLNHPGYWGGIIHMGRDVCIDIKTLRRKALEKAIDNGSGLVRESVCLMEANMTFEEFNLGSKAKTLQSLLASLLSIEENFIALDSLQNLISLTIDLLRKFGTEEAENKLPPVKISCTVTNLKPFDNILRFLGYRIEPSLEDTAIQFVMLPPWNFDELLEMVLGLVKCLHSLRSLSNSAIFHLSKCIAEFDEYILTALHNTLKDLLDNPEQRIYVTDDGINRLWVHCECKEFLESIGLYEVNTSMFLRNGSPFDDMQKITQDFVVVLLKMYREGEILVKQISSTRVEKDVPWFSRKPTKEEIKNKNLLSKRLISTKKKFDGLKKTGQDWHDSTLKSWNLPETEIMRIGPEMKETENVQRMYYGQLKVKVKPGGTPSSCRLPVIQKKDVTKYDRYQQRETLQTALVSNRKELSRRKHLEICQSFKTMES